MTHDTFVGIATDERPEHNALLTFEGTVESAWIDYNGHMTEWQYYKVFADAGENYLRAVGFTEEYRLKGYSFFSVEGHMRNLRECRLGTALRVHTHMIGFDDIRLHIYQYVTDVARDLVLATGEHMMLHVDTNNRRRIKLEPYMRAELAKSLERHRPSLKPKGLGVSMQHVPGRPS